MADNGEVKGKASYYTNKSVDPRWGGTTKSGEKFDETKPTAAVRPTEWEKLKGKKLRVYHDESGKSVDVTVNDTGGFSKYGRVIDLSKSAYEKLADTKTGIINIRYEVLSDSPVANAIKQKDKEKK
jgi:rare lipoprotein A